MKNLSPDNRLKPLDGLRGIAILLVLLYHFTPGRDPNQGLQGLVFKIAEIGWSGVDLFFVLSGFLISRILLSEATDDFSFRNFAMRRILRIVPLCYLAYFVTFMVIPGISALYGFPGLQEQIPFWVFVSNFAVANSSYSEFIHLGHFWSLAIEMQFYLFWPMLVYSLGGKYLNVLLVSLIAISVMAKFFAIIFAASWQVTYGWSPMRLEGLVVGSLIAVNLKKIMGSGKSVPVFLCLASATGLLLFLIAWFDLADRVFKSGEGVITDGLRIFLPILLSSFYGAILILTLKIELFGKLVSCKLLSFFGSYAYGIYVVHYMLFPFFIGLMGPGQTGQPIVPVGDMAIYLFFIGATVVSVVVAVPIYHWYEKPFLGLKKFFPMTTRPNIS